MPPRGSSLCAVCGCPLLPGEIRWCVAQMIPEIGETASDSEPLLAHERCVPWEAKSIAMPYLNAVETWRQLYRRLARAEHRDVAAYVARTGRVVLRELGRWPTEPLVRLEAVRRLGLLVQGAVESHGVERIVSPLALPGGMALEAEARPVPAREARGTVMHTPELQR